MIFVLGVILMRSAGCAINDFADRGIDGDISRTKGRPIVTGRISAKEALITFAVLVGISSFFAQAWWFNEGSGTPITALGTGFYVWLLALALAALGALFAWKVNKAQPANSTEKPAP